MRIRSLARDEFWEIADKAKSQGRDLAEMLDQVGVLVTPARQTEIRCLGIEAAADLLESIAPQHLVPPGVPCTPADVHRYAVQLLRDIAKQGRGA